jgi:AbrB family looped-hinge helix DNA binding protein
MRTTIDSAGRIVIPKPLRDRAGLAPGQEVDVSEADGRIAIEAVSNDVRLVERDGFVAAEVDDDDAPPLTVDDVRSLLERVRR